MDETLHPTATRLIGATISLVERSGGDRCLNVRTIAEEARCVHANIYKHFVSIDRLLWAAAGEMLARQIAFIEARRASTENCRFGLQAFLEAQVDHALQHPALYRFFWMDPREGQPTTEVLQRLETMRALWAEFLTHTPEEAKAYLRGGWPESVVHSFFHGEICKLLRRSALVSQGADAREYIVQRTLRLAAILETSDQAVLHRAHVVEI